MPNLTLGLTLIIYKSKFMEIKIENGKKWKTWMKNCKGIDRM